MAGGDLAPGRLGRAARSGSARAGGRTAAPAGSVEGYLAALDARLAAPRRVRAAVLAELEDGLLEAVAVRVAAGLAEPAAGAAALAEFGDPATVAAAFQPGLAARQARATVAGLLRSGPLLGLCWGATLLASGVTPWHRPHAGPLTVALPLVGLLVAVVWLAAVATFAATGRLGLSLARRSFAAAGAGPARQGSAGVRLAGYAAATAGLLCATLDLSALAALAWVTANAPGAVAAVPAAVAASASLVRLPTAAVASRRCLAALAPLG
ncbi:MAG TPA: permease prefix domain 1-containing protein [Actinomycetes bacterium]